MMRRQRSRVPGIGEGWVVLPFRRESGFGC